MGGLRGDLVFESGFAGDDSVRTSGWLVAEDLPHSQRVDRVFCSEFQALTELCRRLEEHSGAQEDFEAEDPALAAAQRAGLRGEARLLTTGAPCASCLGALCQF